MHTAFIAWALLGTEGPHSEISFYIGSLHFVHWRLFLIICTFPAFVSSISLLFLPESPAYLYHVWLYTDFCKYLAMLLLVEQTGKGAKLLKVLKKIRAVNHASLCCLKRTKKVSFSILKNSTWHRKINLGWDSTRWYVQVFKWAWWWAGIK